MNFETGNLFQTGLASRQTQIDSIHGWSISQNSIRSCCGQRCGYETRSSNVLNTRIFDLFSIRPDLKNLYVFYLDSRRQNTSTSPTLICTICWFGWLGTGFQGQTPTQWWVCLRHSGYLSLPSQPSCIRRWR